MENTERQKNLEGFCLHFKQYYTQTHTHTLNLLWRISRFPYPSVIIRWNPRLKLWNTFLGYQSICLAFCVSWKELRRQDLKHVKKTTYTRTNFKINPPEPPSPCPPSSPDPSPVPRKKCVMKKAKRNKGTTGKRSSDWRGSEEMCRGESNDRDAEGRCHRCRFCLFFQHTD